MPSTTLNCPACTGNLYPIQWQNTIELDICGSCHGLWFDLGELVLVADSDSLANIDNAFVGKYNEIDAEEIQKQQKEAGRFCPKDGKALDRHEYSGEATLVLDYCSHCKGTWMDPGEFEGYVGSQKDLWANFPKATQAQLESVDEGKEEMSTAIYSWCVSVDFGGFLNLMITPLLKLEWAREQKDRKIYSEKYQEQYETKYKKEYKDR